MLSLLIVLALMAGTVYLSLTYENSGLMLLAFMEAALFVLSIFELVMLRITVSGHLTLPVELIEKGNESRIKIKVTNKGLFPVARIKAKVAICDVMRGAKEWHWFTLPAAGRGESTFIGNMRFTKVGSYNIVLKKLRVYDMTGLLHIDISKKSMAQLRVMPKLKEVAVRLTESTKNFYGESDVHDDKLPGYDNSELFQVREYREGDRLQNVHWKLSVKQDDLMVKEHALPKTCPVVLFLDYNPTKKDKKNQAIVPYMEVVVSLSFSLMDAGCSHYIVWYDAAEQDIKRLRVDDEESLFLFIDTLMKIKWVQHKENMVVRYQEKYRGEPYAHALSLDTELGLKKNDELLIQISEKKVEKSLLQVELLL